MVCLLVVPRARFIKQYFLLVCINQMASGLFRFMGAVGRNIIVANTVGSFALLAVMVMGGFILSRGEVLIKKNISVYFVINNMVDLCNIYFKIFNWSKG